MAVHVFFMNFYPYFMIFQFYMITYDFMPAKTPENLDRWMIFYYWSLLCTSSNSWHAYFIGAFGHQLLSEPSNHCHITLLHYECSYCKLCLYFSVRKICNLGNGEYSIVGKKKCQFRQKKKYSLEDSSSWSNTCSFF